MTAVAPLVKAKNLVRLAIDDGAGEHEARTAALLACRLISQHGLLDGAPSQPPPREPKDPPKGPTLQRITVRFGSACLVCGQWVAEGKQAFWARGHGVCHPGKCEHAWRRGAA